MDKVFHRKNAVWPFTVVGRPPQEDTTFGNLIHEISHPMVPASIPGVKEMHAVDAAGVHPLLLALGSERYVPYQRRLPMELLTQANAILGFNRASLAKYLIIATDQMILIFQLQILRSFFNMPWSELTLKEIYIFTPKQLSTL